MLISKLSHHKTANELVLIVTIQQQPLFDSISHNHSTSWQYHFHSANSHPHHQWGINLPKIKEYLLVEGIPGMEWGNHYGAENNCIPFQMSLFIAFPFHRFLSGYEGELMLLGESSWIWAYNHLIVIPSNKSDLLEISLFWIVCAHGILEWNENEIKCCGIPWTEKKEIFS